MDGKTSHQFCCPKRKYWCRSESDGCLFKSARLVLTYIADDDFIDSNGLINAVNYFLDRPKAVVLYAPWKLIQYQNKATSNQFYEIPEDRVFQKGDYQGLLITILEQHAFPEICLFRTATYRLLLPSENAISYWAFTIPAEWISVGEVIFKKEPFYCASTSYFRDETTTR